MPAWEFFEVSADYIRKWRKAIHAHFQKRGVPAYRWSEMEWKWRKQKGWKMPCA
jgi:hypothetical protein